MDGGRSLATPEVPQTTIAAGQLFQHISRVAYRGTPLYFSRDGANRYDSPGMSYGVFYLGFDLPTALMESVFHNHQWHRRTRRMISHSEVRQRLVRAVGAIEDIRLADLTAPGVMASRFGLNLSQLASRRYRHTQRISATLYAIADASGTPAYDGVLYPSRNNHPASCIALFDRAGPKVTLVDDIDLVSHADWPGFVSRYRIMVLPR